MGFGGFDWDIFIALGSLPLAGAGYGRVSVLVLGLLAILAAPVATIAWARRKTNGKKFAMAAVLLLVVANASLYWSTLTEGKEFFFKLLSMALIWLVFWIALQV